MSNKGAFSDGVLTLNRSLGNISIPGMYAPTSPGSSNQYWRSDGSGTGNWTTPASAPSSSSNTLISASGAYKGKPTSIEVTGSGTDSLQVVLTLGDGSTISSNTFSRMPIGPILSMTYSLDRNYSRSVSINGHRSFYDGFPSSATRTIDGYEITYVNYNFYTTSIHSYNGMGDTYSSSEVGNWVREGINEINTNLHLRINGTAYCYFYHPSAQYGYRLFFGNRYSSSGSITINNGEVESTSFSSMNYAMDNAGPGYGYVVHFFVPSSISEIS